MISFSHFSLVSVHVSRLRARCESVDSLFHFVFFCDRKIEKEGMFSCVFFPNQNHHLLWWPRGRVRPYNVSGIIAGYRGDLYLKVESDPNFFYLSFSFFFHSEGRNRFSVFQSDAIRPCIDAVCYARSSLLVFVLGTLNKAVGYFLDHKLVRAHVSNASSNVGSSRVDTL